MPDIELIKQKVQFFFDNKKAIHAVFKRGIFKNGTIKEISSDFFILEDFLVGDMPIFFQELTDVDMYRLRGVE